jgi:hypothetical protein
MDEQGFIIYLEQKGKSKKTINRYWGFIDTYHSYLDEHKSGVDIESAKPQDVIDYAIWADEQGLKTPQHLWAIKEYAEFRENEPIRLMANRLIGEYYARETSIGDFRGVDASHARALASAGIQDPMQMLEAASSSQARELLCRKTGIPQDALLKILKLCDLARIPGLKNIRAPLYYNAGFTTLDEIAQWEPEDLRQKIVEFIEETDFDGSPPQPKEVANTVEMAKYLPRRIEF